jgi:folate-binding protein YgfZ
MTDPTTDPEPRVEARRSPLLGLPGAVPASGRDAGVAAHHGSFNTEQRHLEAGDGFVDLSHRDVLRISGQDRLTWLHSLTTQHLESLPPKQATAALVLSPNGHVEHAFVGHDDGEAFWAHTEPGRGPALAEFLDRMRFMMRVEVSDVSAAYAVTWRPRDGEACRDLDAALGAYELVPRERLEEYAPAAGHPCGTWAFEALRIARGEPRFGVDTDHRTIPNEVGWIGPAVHLDKGCYRGQETVARVHTLGRPPRRLTLLHLDGSENRLPEEGSPVLHGDRQVGFVGSSGRHHELGPVALALLKRNVPVDATLEVDGMPAAQEVVVDPEVGLHVRPRLR